MSQIQSLVSPLGSYISFQSYEILPSIYENTQKIIELGEITYENKQKKMKKSVANLKFVYTESSSTSDEKEIKNVYSP